MTPDEVSRIVGALVLEHHAQLGQYVRKIQALQEEVTKLKKQLEEREVRGES